MNENVHRLYREYIGRACVCVFDAQCSRAVVCERSFVDRRGKKFRCLKYDIHKAEKDYYIIFRCPIYPLHSTQYLSHYCRCPASLWFGGPVDASHCITHVRIFL